MRKPSRSRIPSHILALCLVLLILATNSWFNAAMAQSTTKPITERGSVLREVLVKHIRVPQPGPLPGQDSRATPDFALNVPPEYTELRWEISDGDRDAEFSLNRNHVGGADPRELNGISDGMVTQVIRGGSLYIAGVQAEHPFNIRVYARVYER